MITPRKKNFFCKKNFIKKLGNFYFFLLSANESVKMDGEEERRRRRRRWRKEKKEKEEKGMK